QPLLDMERIRRHPDTVTIREIIRREIRFRTYRSLPELDLLLSGADIIQICQSGRRGTGKTASIPPNDREQAFHDARFDDDVVVDEMDIGRGALFEQELTLLRHPSP